ncbi:MAG: hypothetical protein EA397_02205 [Deltaproteobacteria bacterium]|nr:MAG: hypothetical protein EA397_02205 [Deltaproteobacteria bacterium]
MDESHQGWIEAEESLLKRSLQALHEIRRADQERESALVAKGRALTAERTALRGDKLQQQVLDQALDETAQHLEAHRRANKARTISLEEPYFAHLELVEEGRARDVLLGKGTVIDRRLPAQLVDWREAPISRLYYEYEQGDEFCEEIAGREREGEIAIRRRLDIRSGVLQEIGCGEVVLRRRPGGWIRVGGGDPQAPVERSEREDHRLPDIVSLITPDQFAILTRPEAGVVLLRGQAGSGKTTVALHRIAYLHYQDPDRFQPSRALVVMFNKALQTYVSKSLDDLDLRGVRVETFHGWARQHLAHAGPPLRFQAGTPPKIAEIKRHPAMEGLLRATVEDLGSKAERWFDVPPSLQGAFSDLAGSGLERLHGFFSRHDLPPHAVAQRDRLVSRLQDHLRDLRGLFDDLERCQRCLPTSLHDAIPLAREQMAQRGRSQVVDFEDAALLLRLGQLKHQLMPGLRCPWRGQFTQVVIDEAQDLSLVEIAVLIEAADEGRSVTIAGDPAQTLYRTDAVDFEALLGQLTGRGATRLDTLPVGHRSSAPIMALALKALGRSDPALIAQTRPGGPVLWLETDRAATLAEELRAFRETRPNSLIAVLCKQRREADAWFGQLRPLLPEVRRGERARFTFEPGVVVTNVHQVKGLEFDGVVVVEPSAYRDHERRLLHVAITRAADRLWIVASRGRGLLG